jgi:hypothetical protein
LSATKSRDKNNIFIIKTCFLSSTLNPKITTKKLIYLKICGCYRFKLFTTYATVREMDQREKNVEDLINRERVVSSREERVNAREIVVISREEMVKIREAGIAESEAGLKRLKDELDEKESNLAIREMRMEAWELANNK